MYLPMNYVAPLSTVSGLLFSMPVAWQSPEMLEDDADPCKL